MLPWLSLLWLVQKKNIKSGILVFLEAQEINLRRNLQGSKCDRYCIFFWETFSFYKKFPSLLDPEGFFQDIFMPTPDVFNWSTNLPAIYYEKRFKPKNCYWNYQRNGMSSAKTPRTNSIFQIPAQGIFKSKSSVRVFFTKF